MEEVYFLIGALALIVITLVFLFLFFSIRWRFFVPILFLKIIFVFIIFVEICYFYQNREPINDELLGFFFSIRMTLYPALLLWIIFLITLVCLIFFIRRAIVAYAIMALILFWGIFCYSDIVLFGFPCFYTPVYTCDLGRMYMYRGDFEKAHRWLYKSAHDNEAEAQYAIASLYSNHKYKGSDMVKSFMWYNIALKNGYEPNAETVTKFEYLKKSLTQEQLEEANLGISKYEIVGQKKKTMQTELEERNIAE